MEADLLARLDLAVTVAREAGRGTLRHFRDAALAVETKADASPVTEADREAERLLRARIGAAFPHDAILGEELGEQAGASGWRWIVDPIDGTRAFVHGVPLYGTLVGVERDGRPVAGAVWLPAADEGAYAAAGGPAWRLVGDGTPVLARVSAQARLADAVVCTSDVANFRPGGRSRVWEELARPARVARTWGDCFGYYLVAIGRADVMIDPIMSVWDAAALAPILEAAGGTYTDWNGRPTIHGGDGLATNGLLLEEALGITRGR
jgi:histidinol phosphatase-like enzyme (inositol monophosphatase family)